MGKEYDIIKNSNDKLFIYQLLDRLRNDCNYYLDYGNRQSKCLWAGNVDEQIELMKDIWNNLDEDEKPEWLTWEDILEYERQMTNKL